MDCNCFASWVTAVATCSIAGLTWLLAQENKKLREENSKLLNLHAPEILMHRVREEVSKLYLLNASGYEIALKAVFATSNDSIKFGDVCRIFNENYGNFGEHVQIVQPLRMINLFTSDPIRFCYHLQKGDNGQFNLKNFKFPKDIQTFVHKITYFVFFYYPEGLHRLYVHKAEFEGTKLKRWETKPYLPN